MSSTLDVSGRIDTVALFNLDGASVNVTMLDRATEVHNEDYSLVSTDGIADWFSRLFEPIVRKTELLCYRPAQHARPSLTATVTDTDNVSVGAFVAGWRFMSGYAIRRAGGDYRFQPQDTGRFRQLVHRRAQLRQARQLHGLDRARALLRPDIQHAVIVPRHAAR